MKYVTIKLRIPEHLVTSRMTSHYEYNGVVYTKINGRPTLYFDGPNRAFFSKAAVRLAAFEDAVEEALKKKEKND